jgi:hypothetical protein
MGNEQGTLPGSQNLKDRYYKQKKFLMFMDRAKHLWETFTGSGGKAIANAKQKEKEK